MAIFILFRIYTGWITPFFLKGLAILTIINTTYPKKIQSKAYAKTIDTREDASISLQKKRKLDITDHDTISRLERYLPFCIIII